MQKDRRSSLQSLVASYISIRPTLIEKAQLTHANIQELISKKIIMAQIKDPLFPIKLRTPENAEGIEHRGVCALETISKARQVISVGCDGQIAICDEQAMDKCALIDTNQHWYCATLKCEPPLLCLADLSGHIGFMGLDDKQPKNICKVHGQTINALSLSPDQEQLISCSNDTYIKLLEVANGKERGVYKGHTRAVKNAFSLAAHQKILSAAGDKTIRVWDIQTAQEEHRYSLTQTVFRDANFFRLARHPHEDVAISGLNNGMLAVWDIRVKRMVDRLKGHRSVISALLCSDDGYYCASASWDGKARLWDLRMPACAAILAFHNDWVQSIASLYNFQKIISGSRDGMVKIWDVSSILAVDKMNNLKEVVAKAALIAAQNPISNEERLEMLSRIIAK